MVQRTMEDAHTHLDLTSGLMTQAERNFAYPSIIEDIKTCILRTIRSIIECEHILYFHPRLEYVRRRVS